MFAKIPVGLYVSPCRNLAEQFCAKPLCWSSTSCARGGLHALVAFGGAGTAEQVPCPRFSHKMQLRTRQEGEN